MANALTPHPCLDVEGENNTFKICRDEVECGGYPWNATDRYNKNSRCDKDGCDLNPHRVGLKDFYGPGKTVDTNKPVTVVTRFHTVDKTDTGDLESITRTYYQKDNDGKLVEIAEPMSKINAKSLLGQEFDNVSDSMCAATKKVFGDEHNDYHVKGGMKQMGKSLERGMVLVMSVWDDASPGHMSWLDGTNGSGPGAERGPCSAAQGANTRDGNNHKAHVDFSNIRVGPIGTTTPQLKN